MAGRTVICAICGQSFTAPAPRTKYCSPKCRAIGANQARKEWRVFGMELEGIEQLIPLDWNKKVYVERYE